MNRRDFSFGALIGFAFAGSGMLAGLSLKVAKKSPAKPKPICYIFNREGHVGFYEGIPIYEVDELPPLEPVTRISPMRLLND